MACGAPMPADLANTHAAACPAANPQASANSFSLFLADNGRANVDIRGLVYKPMYVVAEFGGGFF